MSEVDEVSQRTRQLTMTLLSAALAAAQAAQMIRAHKAQEARRVAAAEQARLRRQLQADRAGAAVLWKRALDPRLAATHPEQLAQAWSSAVAWETLDARAAATARQLDARLRAAGVHPEMARAARESDDYAALALLLARAEEPNAAVRAEQGEQRPEIEDLFQGDAGEFLDMTAIIEEALDPQTAQEVLVAEALPALEAELAHVAGRGDDPVEVLSRVAAQRSLGDAVDPAAVLHYRLQRDLYLDSESTSRLAADGEDSWWLLDEATRDETGAAHDHADAEAERWAERAADTIATDPQLESLIRDTAQTAAKGHGAEADRLEGDATALALRAQDTSVAAVNAAAGPEPGFTGGSPIARLAAESYPHSIHTALARDNQTRPTPKARTRRAVHQAEHDR